MTLPSNHSCDGPGCDPEDEDHRALRIKVQNQLKVRAGSKADQAWAKARDMMPALTKVREQLKGQGSLNQDDIDLIDVALCLVLGELYLRKAESY